MRILFLNQYYYPDIAATAQLLADVCEELAAAGHEVTVLCGTARYRLPHRGTQPATDKSDHTGPLPATELHAGVHIRRIPVWGAGKSRPVSGLGIKLLRRAAAELSFSLGVAAELWHLGLEQGSEPPPVVVALSSPPLLLALGCLARARLGSPLLYWVQDVYPELLFALGALSRDKLVGRLADRVLSQLWRGLYRHVDAAVALDAAMAQRLTAGGLPGERIRIVEHFADCREIRPQPATENRLRQSLGLVDAFVVGYAGNLGRGHDFETVAAALTLLDRADAPPEAASVHFLFIGDGEKKARLLAAVPPGLRSRVHFLPPQARSELRDVMTAGDVGLITLADGLAGLMVPSKLYALLAAGLPIVYVGPQTGRVAEICAQEQLGESVRNGDAAGLIAGILRLQSDPQRRKIAGQHGRQLAVTHYDRPIVAARHAAVLSEVQRRGPSEKRRAGR